MNFVEPLGGLAPLAEPSPDLFGTVRQLVPEVATRRRIAWELLCRITAISRESRPFCPRRVWILAGSSRGGTSTTAELLQWQGSGNVDPQLRLLSLPGEEKPFLVLSGLAYPTRSAPWDDLTATDLTASSRRCLSGELASEIGSPWDGCSDMRLYAVQLYRRLLLQWPEQLLRLDLDECVDRLEQALRRAFPDGYRDSATASSKALCACVQSFPFIQPAFYDCWVGERSAAPAALSGEAWSIEETPFVLPPPWRNATSVDIEHGCVLLRDPSNAWRMGFWRAMFPDCQMNVLHLVRDPCESVQGLCDGWNHPFGFQTMPANESVRICGYNEHTSIGTADKWKRHRWNFSISRFLHSRMIRHHSGIDLATVCALQWLDAHESVLASATTHRVRRTVFSFSRLREAPPDAYQELCDLMQLEASEGGRSRSESFEQRWVMSTASSGRDSHKRWRSSRFSRDIEALLTSGFFDPTWSRLGLGRSRPGCS